MRRDLAFSLFIAIVGLSASLASAEVVTLHLENGHTVSGELLARTDDKLVIDLGFDVLTIPADVVLELVNNESESTQINSDSDSHQLYRDESGRDRLPVSDNVNRVGAAVVEIRTPTSLGSGFVIHPDGWVITNAHVISGEHRLSVTVFDRDGDGLQRRTFEAVRIDAVASELDLALLKVDTGGEAMASVPVSALERIADGEPVFAIGSPLGFDRTVSEGIVSTAARALDGYLYLQTTTQINAGNSGGPLFNLRGEVVGVTNLKLAGIAIEGMSFAIPISTVQMFLDHRGAFAFDPRNPNAGFRYLEPPRRQDSAEIR